MHRILSILCYVVAGFFVYAAGLMSFVGKVPLTPKLSLCCGAVAIGALFLGIGLAFVRYKYWRRDIGVVCLAGVAVAVSVVLCFYWTVWVAPEALRRRDAPTDDRRTLGLGLRRFVQHHCRWLRAHDVIEASGIARRDSWRSGVTKKSLSSKTHSHPSPTPREGPGPKGAACDSPGRSPGSPCHQEPRALKGRPIAPFQSAAPPNRSPRAAPRAIVDAALQAGCIALLSPALQ